MNRYVINKNQQPSGEHEVHKTTCNRLPILQNQILLGDFFTCKDAINAARVKYPQNKIDGCYYCIPECHRK